MPSSPTRQAPPRPPQQPPATGPGAAAATAATTALPPTVAAIALSRTATAALLAGGYPIDKAFSALTRFHAKVRVQNERVLRKTLEKKTPKEDIAQAIADEARVAAIFQQRSHLRLKARLGDAAKLDKAKMRAKVQTAIDLERRYAVQHQEMVAQRAVAAVDRAALRRESPTGAAWLLGSAKTHTPECVAMAGKLWPWYALDYHAFWPPVHGGCQCHLMGAGPAHEAGHVTSLKVPDPVDAIRAIQVIRDLHTKESADGLELSRYRALLVQTGVLTEGQFDESIKQSVEEALCPR